MLINPTKYAIDEMQEKLEPFRLEEYEEKMLNDAKIPSRRTQDRKNMKCKILSTDFNFQKLQPQIELCASILRQSLLVQNPPFSTQTLEQIFAACCGV
uniref:Uncharacterized protein n=1 Tax=Romanomermis culicivorax TaxID=13658 RepID=A0A915J9P8_ROMCU